MSKFVTLLMMMLGVNAWAATYTIAAGSSAATIQGIIDLAGASSGNTVAFSAGSYHLTDTVTLPCSHGTVYTGPNVGVVTQTNLPSALLSSTVPGNYALSTDSNGTAFTAGQGCTIQYLRFTGTQGGILVYYPASGITIQENAFDNNNPPAGGNDSSANIFLTGDNSYFTPDTGVSHITIVWNTFFNNCADIRAMAWPDSGGGCAATWVDAYNNYLTWSNNTIKLTEEGLKLSEPTVLGLASLNAVVENNNMQGNSRIMIESQQDTNGAGSYSHNAFYQPFNPSYNTFELSIPEWTLSASPTHTVTDNVMIGNVPVTIGGSGAHYGIGLELWGAGSVATNSLFQGGNGGETCEAGWGCSGWGITVGGTFTNATVTGNYFSGSDVWMGSASDLDNAVTYEQDASSSNAGLVITPNTVVQTSVALPTTAPTITSSGNTVTISDSDTKHRLSIFYTTDGSKPAIFGPGGASGSTRLYSSPFLAAAGATVNAIASWGQGANQGLVFPSFGYVPSSVVTAAVGSGGGSSASGATAGQQKAARSLVGAYLSARGNVNTMKMGSTLQFSAVGIYSDGTSGTLPDAAGNKVTAWNTTNHKIAKVSTQGHVTAMGAGVVKVMAMVGSVPASPWTVTVGGAVPAVAAASTHAEAQVSAAANASAELQAMEAAAAPLAQAPGQTSAQGSGQTAESSAGQSVEPGGAGDGSTPGTTPGSTPGTTPGSGATPAAGAGTVLAGPVPSGPGAPTPDTFLGPFWRLVRPAGGSASISQAHLFLGVPGGANHDALHANNQAVRVVQAIGNDDFDVAIKIDSALVATDVGTTQGLMVLSDSKNFFTFALGTDGSHIGLSVQVVTGGAATTVMDDKDFTQYQNPLYLRLTRTGSAWVALHSIDGVNWNQAAAFSDSKATVWVGPFAGNYNDTPANAVPVVMSVNWFDVLQ